MFTKIKTRQLSASKCFLQL